MHALFTFYIFRVFLRLIKMYTVNYFESHVQEAIPINLLTLTYLTCTCSHIVTTAVFYLC